MGDDSCSIATCDKKNREQFLFLFRSHECQTKMPWLQISCNEIVSWNAVLECSRYIKADLVDLS